MVVYGRGDCVLNPCQHICCGTIEPAVTEHLELKMMLDVVIIVSIHTVFMNTGMIQEEFSVSCGCEVVPR